MKFLKQPLLLLVALTLLGPSLLAQTPREALNTLLASKSLDPKFTAIYIWDLDEDLPVVTYQPDTPLVPASVMKCVTVGALSSVLPYRHRISTPVFLEGKMEGKALVGNIVVKGSGDPSLEDGRHKGQPSFPGMIAEALKEHGIERVEGEIIIDNSYFAGPPTPPSWVEGDLSQAYGTGSHAFNYEGNASGKAAIRNPDEIFRRRLKKAFEDSGIAYEEKKHDRSSMSSQPLLTYSSPFLKDLMTSCMFRSDNLYAETFLRLYGAGKGSDGSTAAAAKLAMQYWDTKNYPMKGVDIIDGSGLSRSNHLTAQFLGEVLKGLSTDPNYVAFFPLVGEEGTVRNFLKNTTLQEYLSLKTGSMSGIQSYAGYMLDEDYEPTHVVVIMTNGLKNRTEFREALSKFFLAIFKPSQIEPDI